MRDIPTRTELWAAVQEAHDYLYQYLNDLSSRYIPDLGTIEFDAWDWGSKVDRTCTVCLAGLYLLRREHKLFHDSDTKMTPLLGFLDDLRNPDQYEDKIEEWLGVSVDYDSSYIADDGLWDSGNPEHILHFLGWLLDAGKEQELYVS